MTEVAEMKVESVEGAAPCEITIHPEVKYVSELKPGYIVDIHYLDKTELFEVQNTNTTSIYNLIKVWLRREGVNYYLDAQTTADVDTINMLSLSRLNHYDRYIIAKSVRIYLVESKERDFVAEAIRALQASLL